VKLIGSEDRDESSGTLSSICSGVLYFVSVILIIMLFPFSLMSMIKVIPEYQRAVIFRLGRLRSEGGDDWQGSGPGMFCVIPCTDDYIPVDLRTRPFDVTPQEILTKDSVTVTVDAVVYFRVEKPLLAVNNSLSYEWATRLLAKTTLRNVLGAHSLAEILSEKESIAGQMREILDQGTDLWGVKVERCEMLVCPPSTLTHT
jgi:erythrocyte band 7 integral membrane protein